MSHNFRTIVARDGVGDRSLAAHEANLFDMEQKYADLMDAAALVAWVNRAAAARSVAPMDQSLSWYFVSRSQ